MIPIGIGVYQLIKEVGVSGISIKKGCKIHDTGRDCIKITPGCNDIQIIDCEIYNSGVGPENLPVNGGPNAEGIDNVNGARMIVRNCYFHDISTNGLYAKGGSKGSIIENNLIRNVGDAGIGIGFYTDGEWFDPVSNPKYYESIQTIVRNNFIINSGGAGLLFLWGLINAKHIIIQ
ncbi:MAG: right-handed parallel beta-helix repeat-containing protein [Saprospiraceae bacterium]|nr:right-handed parallel beta-helix repeat-containing protein [Saprospiraceae bacterium]